MARKKRPFTTFSLSFLDIMSCGFGAVILVFLIIDHSIDAQSNELNADLLSEVNLLNEDISEGEKDKVRLRNTLSDVDLKIVEAQGRATRINDDISEFEALIAALKRDGFTERADIESLKAEIQSLEEEVKKQAGFIGGLLTFKNRLIGVSLLGVVVLIGSYYYTDRHVTQANTRMEATRQENLEFRRTVATLSTGLAVLNANYTCLKYTRNFRH